MPHYEKLRGRLARVYAVMAFLVALPLLIIVYFDDDNTESQCLNDPIDIVYYYVNGSDPEQQSLLEALGPRSALSKASTKNRYRDWGELRYSVRSVFTNAPWFRRMYFVLRNNSTQVPLWLDRTKAGDRVSIVTHDHIFANSRHLPTLSSNAIEANLHRIPGLSRRFVVMNDDFFFFRRVSQRRLFNTYNEHAVCMYLANMPDAGMHLEEPSATQRCAQRISTLLDATYGRRTRRDECHAPQPIDGVLMRQLQEQYSGEFEAASAAKFRSDTICPRLFYNHWVLESQQGRFETNSRLSALRFSLLVQLRTSVLLTKAQFLLARVLRPFYLGINDDVSEDATDEQIAKVAQAFTDFVEAQFPHKSPIER